jgi:hypothetical protein
MICTESHNTLNRWKNYFSKLLKVHNISYVRSPSFEDETAIVKLKKYKSPGSAQIAAELFQAGGETLVSVIQKLIISIMLYFCILSHAV